MNMMCLAAGRAVPEISVVGLCHSVQGTSHLLAEYADIPYREMQWECAGINHLAWFTKLQHKGQDLYTTKLYEKFAQQIREGIKEADAGLARYDDADVSPRRKDDPDVKYQHDDLVRKDMCVNFGAFITESSGHLSEYLPYYRKSDAGRKLLRLSYNGGSRFYASHWPKWRQQRDEDRESLLRGDEQMDWERTWEYASWIIEAREKDVPYRIHGNVMNCTPGSSCGPGGGSGEGKLISNLPSDGCVEVACMIDTNGIHPTRFGALPPQMAAICASNMSMFDLGAKAAIEKSKEAAIHALMLDPLCAAVCTPSEIRAMACEMFEAEKDFLVGYG
jgi:alpha-galactosidase